jgi:crotonobetainyl-CoA:carnitine CoA-transferase CaiB-like acyl-CoA transferase
VSAAGAARPTAQEHESRARSEPLDGVSVVEVTGGSSDLGLGLAGGLPGMILADLGATVVRIVDPAPPAIDAGVTWRRAWHRDKRIEATDDPLVIAERLAAADVALVYGPSERIEGRGLGWLDLHRANPDLVYARCRPSRTAGGEVADYGLLVEARSGFCTQLAGHRDGPIFADVRATGAGTAFVLTTSVLALLRRRVLGGGGGWAETSLYDGMLATLGTMIGRSERAPEPVESYWASGSTFPNFLYRCADGELIQVWFGGKGMYTKLLEVLGDEPSADGYYADQTRGALQARAQRWKGFFVRESRETWIERLRAAGVACEPVLAPGEGLADPDLAVTGLATERMDGDRRDVVVATPIAVTPVPTSAPVRASSTGGHRGLLGGLRVVDFSAFVAGPLAAQVLADLGADVIKVEPLEGEAMRAAAYAVAACQRGKRSLALDLGAEAGRPVVERLIRWADVVLHNFRVGVSERLGIDEATVAALNPGAVYCHARSFAATGPRARMPGNDALMQALTGFEWALGGEGNDPLGATWIPLDMAGGWMAAAGTLAGLYARAAQDTGQQVATSLFGAGLLLHSGVFRRDGEVVAGPRLDTGQTGYGPGYRIYRAGDDRWLAVVLADPDVWDRLRAEPGLTDLPVTYAPLRGGDGDADARRAEVVLEAAIASAPADEWAGRLRAAGALVEPVVDVSRDGFRRRILDDPVNRQLGRTAHYSTPEWGSFDQIGRLLRTGPGPATTTPAMLPGVGEHTVDVLTDLGFDPDEIAALVEADAVRTSVL